MARTYRETFLLAKISLHPNAIGCYGFGVKPGKRVLR
jgi:hypothetical protein